VLTSSLRKLIKSIKPNNPFLEPSDIHDLRQTLQFITLVFQVDASVTTFFHGQTISSLLRHILQKLSSLSGHDQNEEAVSIDYLQPEAVSDEMKILRPLFTVLAAMEFRRARDGALNEIKRPWDARLTWQIAIDKVEPDDVPSTGDTSLSDIVNHITKFCFFISATFAAFVVGDACYGEGLDILTAAAVWDLLRDYLLLVFQGYFFETPEERLSFAICPLVFEALDVLMRAMPSIGMLSRYLFIVGFIKDNQHLIFWLLLGRDLSAKASAVLFLIVAAKAVCKTSNCSSRYLNL
jgi:hypothetical protein